MVVVVVVAGTTTMTTIIIKNFNHLYIATFKTKCPKELVKTDMKKGTLQEKIVLTNAGLL